jgi:hypothetical protein
MSTEAGSGIRFCDEYESLMSEFLRALSTWTQLRCLQEGPALSSSRSVPVNSILAQAELPRSHASYAAALWALRLHSRSCLLCAEKLRMVNGEVVVNGEVSPSSAFRTTNYC